MSRTSSTDLAVSQYPWAVICICANGEHRKGTQVAFYPTREAAKRSFLVAKYPENYGVEEAHHE